MDNLSFVDLNNYMGSGGYIDNHALLSQFCAGFDTLIINSFFILLTLWVFREFVIPLGFKFFENSAIFSHLTDSLSMSRRILAVSSMFFLVANITIFFIQGLSTKYYYWASILVLLTIFLAMVNRKLNKMFPEEQEQYPDILKIIKERLNDKK